MTVYQTLFLLFSTLLISQSLQQTYFKHRAGPPTEFPLHTYPNPLSAAQQEETAVHEVTFTSDQWTSRISIDSTTRFSFFFLLPGNTADTVALVDSNNIEVPLIQDQVTFPYSDSGESFPTILYTFQNPKPGYYTVKAHSGESVSGYLVTYNQSPNQILSYLSTYQTIVNHPVGLMATLIDTASHPFDGESVPTQNLGTNIRKSELEIVFPDGHEVFVPMHDDGVDGDETSGDGIFTGTIIAPTVGLFRARSLLEGTFEDGTPFERTSDHVFNVIGNEYVIPTTVAIGTHEGKEIKIDIPLKGLNSNPSMIYKGYSEVWGFDSNRNQIPICWIGGYSSLESGKVSLFLNPDWISLSKAAGPFTLKNLRIEDSDSHVVVASSQHMVISMPFGLKSRLSSQISEISGEMLTGPRPANLSFETSALSSPHLVAIHGFCSGANPFKARASDFSCCSMAYFEDPNKSRSHKQFADLLNTFIKNYPKVSFVAHSQGGAASLTLIDGVWSPLDDAALSLGKFTIQTLGTPWTGCSGASWSGLIPGGCSSVEDLTPSGASKWIATISADARSKVTYTYTREKDSKQCNSLVNLILKKPNDGTTEAAYAELSGGSSAPNNPAIGECHTTGMTWPPQYENSARNKNICTSGCPL
eukprot:TRINITY_DN807_c0_g7_i1.p1 TRINITY_DN807_c0_g7~~TRINITY_DN807_c0_g7_i1.p1  ORF type:complete len:675 (+),score=119.67 TRINITY_DN807_c0_g7_i1:96-2027(+)